MGLRLTDVVKNLLIINVIGYILTHFTGDFGREWLIRLSVFFPTSEYFQPYQIVTYMFMHGDLMHIFFNMFALVMFGTAIEQLWGPKRFLFYYFFTGFGALALEFIVKYFELTNGSIPPDAVNVPNGSVITDDGKRLLLAESLQGRLTEFTINADGSLANRRVFA